MNQQLLNGLNVTIDHIRRGQGKVELHCYQHGKLVEIHALNRETLERYVERAYDADYFELDMRTTLSRIRFSITSPDELAWMDVRDEYARRIADCVGNIQYCAIAIVWHIHSEDHSESIVARPARDTIEEATNDLAFLQEERWGEYTELISTRVQALLYLNTPSLYSLTPMDSS